MKFGASVIDFLSAEWMLEGGRPNGGDVVVLRTLWIGGLLIAFLALLRALAVLSDGMLPLVKGIGAALRTSLNGAETPTIFGATYAALPRSSNSARSSA